DNVFSDAQVLTATAASTNYIDLQLAGDLREGMHVQVKSPTILDSAGDAATLLVSWQTDTVSNFASPTTLIQTAAIAEADLTAGIIAQFNVPKGLQRYNRLYYTVGTEDFTTGTITAQIQNGVDNDNAPA
ncbi:unnamed protein product, partial [marine sediment metagenome]